MTKFGRFLENLWLWGIAAGSLGGSLTLILTGKAAALGYTVGAVVLLLFGAVALAVAIVLTFDIDRTSEKEESNGDQAM